ncbi:MAG: hypothetical protein AAFV01_16790 [Bacteroidota bacterium]
MTRPDRKPLRRGTTTSPPPHEAASAQLRFIRDAMERSARFTAVPGWGGVAMGVTALGAAWLAAQQPTPSEWLRVWAGEAVVGVILGLVFLIRKAQASGLDVRVGQGRKFLLGLAPALLAGVALTLAVYGFDVGPTKEYFVRQGAVEATASLRLLPGLWLLCYGVGVISAGMFSVRLVPTMGLGFLGLGLLALLSPAAWGTAYLAAGFGGLHVIFGILIARKHGG